MDIKKILGENVKYLRDIVGLTQQGMADKIGVESGGYISNLESGKKWPRPEIMTRIAEALEVNIKDLFDDGIETQTKEEKQLLNKWNAKFQNLFKNKDEEDIEAIYEFVKKMSRSKKRK